MFNKNKSQGMFFRVLPSPNQLILAGQGHLFEPYSGSMFVYDVSVSRWERFTGSED